MELVKAYLKKVTEPILSLYDKEANALTPDVIPSIGDEEIRKFQISNSSRIPVYTIGSLHPTYIKRLNSPRRFLLSNNTRE